MIRPVANGAAIVLLACCAFLTAAHAAFGDPDLSFGTNGVASIPAASGTDFGLTGGAPRHSYFDPPLHLWTTDSNEKDTLVAQYGWRYEGVVGEVLP